MRTQRRLSVRADVAAPRAAEPRGMTTRHHDRNPSQWAGSWKRRKPTGAAPTIGRAVGATLALLLTAPVLVWVVVGDQSLPDAKARGMFETDPVIPVGLQPLAGIAAGLVVLGAAYVLDRAARFACPERRGRWMFLLLCWLAAESWAAITYRCINGASLDANIGAGLMMLTLPPMAFGLAGITAAVAWQLRRGCGEPRRASREPASERQHAFREPASERRHASR